MPNSFKDKNFFTSLDESSKRWLQNMMRTLNNNIAQNQGANQKLNNNNENNNYMLNNPNNIIQVNNMTNINQMTFDNNNNNYYYPNNMSGYFPNDANNNNMFIGSNNYYFPMAKMYNNTNNPYNLQQGQIPNTNAGNPNNIYNIDKKL